VCVDIFLKARIAKFLLFKDNCEFWSIECTCNEKSVLGFLTRFMYVLHDDGIRVYVDGVLERMQILLAKGLKFYFGHQLSSRGSSLVQDVVNVL